MTPTARGVPAFEVDDVVRTPTGPLGTVRQRYTSADYTWIYDVRLHHLNLVLVFCEADLEEASAVDRLGDLA